MSHCCHSCHSCRRSLNRGFRPSLSLCYDTQTAPIPRGHKDLRRERPSMERAAAPGQPSPHPHDNNDKNAHSPCGTLAGPARRRSGCHMTPDPARGMAAGRPRWPAGARTGGRAVEHPPARRAATRANVDRDTRPYASAANGTCDIAMRRFLVSRRYLEKKDLRRGQAKQSRTGT